MAKDFRSDRVRTRAIIGTGSVVPGKKNLNLMFYSGSKAANYDGLTTGLDTTKVGNDVWLYFDGAANSAVEAWNRADGSTVLFGGDVVVSGTLWSERSVIEVDDAVPGDFKAFNKVIGGIKTTPEDYTTGYARILVDPTTSNPSANRDGTISFNMVQGVAGVYAYATQFPTTHKDVFFHVSGSRGVKDSNDRGLALFDGDVHVSGNFSLSPLSIFTVPGDFTIGGDLQINGNDIKNSEGEITISMDVDQNVSLAADLTVVGNDIKGSAGTNLALGASGDVSVSGDLTVTGNDIKGSAGTNITLGAGGDVTTTGNLTVAGNIIKASDGGSTITMDTDDNVLIAGDLTVMGSDIKGSDGNTAITLGGSVLPTIIAGDIQINGQDIKGADGVLALHLSGSGNATFDKNLTVVGDLNVSGSVTTIGTENLRVKDALIILASGSTTNSTKGGIAIASGSTINNNALVFGTAEGTAAPGAFRAGYMDVQDGAITSIDAAQPVNIQAAGLIFKNRTGSGFTNTFVTASINSGATELKIQNDDGSIFLTPNASGVRGVEIADDTALYFDGQGGSKTQQIKSFSDQLRLQHADAGGVLVIGDTGTNAKVRFQTSAHYIFSANDSEGLCVTGSRGVNIGATHVGEESGLILSASSEELVGGPVLVLSASDQFNGTGIREGYISVGSALSELPGLFTANRHRDVRTILSGTVGTKDSNTRGVTLVSGDLVVSGNTALEGTFSVTALDIANLTLSSATANEPYLRFRDSDVQIRRTSGNHLEFSDTASPSSPYTLTQLAALSVTDNSDVFAVTHQDGSVPYLSYIASTGSFSFDHDRKTDGYVARRTNQIGKDVFFFVSGAIDSREDLGIGTVERGVAVFGGDMVVSGALRIQNPYTLTPPGTANSIPLQVGASSGTGATALAVTGSIELVDPGSTRVDISAKNVGMSFKVGSGGQTALDISSTKYMTAYGTLQMDSNNTIALKSTNRTIHGFLEDSVEKLKLKNAESNGVIILEAGGGTGHLAMTGSMLPGANSTYSLGSPDHRWANVYTGDLHLKNERGNWTIYEEPDMLVVVNNLTGKKYKMGLTPLEDIE